MTFLVGAASDHTRSIRSTTYSRMEITQFLCGLFILIVITGIFGNGVTIFTFLKSATLRVPQNIFIVNLALCDSLFIAAYIPFIAKALNEDWDPSEFGCNLMAFLLFLSSGTSIVCMGFLALSRYVIIVRKSLRKWFEWKYTLPLAIICWLYTFIFFIGVFTKNARVVFYPNLHGCMVDYSYNLGYTITLACGMFFPMSTLILIFYWRIYKVFRDAKKKVNSHMGNDSHQSLSQKHLREEFVLALQLFIIFVLFEVSLAPGIITIVFFDSTGSKLSGNTYIVIEMLTIINSAANPYLYLVFHKTFRAKLFKMIRLQSETDSHSTDSKIRTLTSVIPTR